MWAGNGISDPIQLFHHLSPTYPYFLTLLFFSQQFMPSSEGKSLSGENGEQILRGVKREIHPNKIQPCFQIGE